MLEKDNAAHGDPGNRQADRRQEGGQDLTEVNIFALGQDARRAALFGGRARVPLAAVWRRDAGGRRRGRCDFLVSVAAGADGDLSPDFLPSRVSAVQSCYRLPSRFIYDGLTVQLVRMPTYHGRDHGFKFH